MDTGELKRSFNRTTVECKSSPVLTAPGCLKSFNRTTVECKLVNVITLYNWTQL